jgi:hypothetical protein
MSLIRDLGHRRFRLTKILVGLGTTFLIAVSVLGQTCVLTPAGLVGWWPGENTTQDLAAGNDGTLVGNATFATAEVGSGFSFDGSGSAVTMTNTAALQLQDFTIECWFQRADTTIVTHGTHTTALFFSYGSGGYGFGITDSGNLFLTQIDIGNVTLNAPIADTVFHHVAVTKAGNTVVIYVDGMGNTMPAYNPRFAFNSNPAIGARADTMDDSFLGIIDEVAVYNRALDGLEILAIYNAGSAGKCAASTPASIFAPPTNQVVRAGATVAFKVLAAGSPPISYQWLGHGTNINGATNYLLSFNSAQATDQGGYQVVVTNAYGAVTSGIVTLTVDTPPVINDPPQPQTVPPGSAAVFLVGATGSAPLSFQWYFNATNPVGANQYALTITNVQSANVGEYSVVVTNPVGAVTSAPAALVLAVPPTVTLQPVGQNVPAGANLSFSVAATGPGQLLYQWRCAGTNLPGATSSMLVLNNVQAINAGAYSVGVTNAYGGVVSSNALLMVTNPACAIAPAGLVGWWQAEGSGADAVSTNSGVLSGKAAFVPGKIGQAFLCGSNADAVLLANSAALQLQDFTIEAWIKRASTAVVTRGSVANGMFFSYGSGGYGFYIDAGGVLRLTRVDVNNVGAGISITDTNFHHVAVTKSGATVVFYLDGVAYPAPPYVNSGYTFGTRPAIGARGDNLIASFYGCIDELAVYNRPLTPPEVQSIYFATSQGKCASPLAWLSEPTNQSVTLGSSVVFSGSVIGSQPISYQWDLNGAPLPGATSAVLNLANVTWFQAGAYSLTASNGAGPIFSSNAVLTIRQAPLLANGSFETADFTGWVANDLAVASVPMAIRPAGYNSGFGFFSATPTDGNFCFVEGFDGGGPGRIRLAADVKLPASPVLLTFTYRAAWDMLNYSGSTLPRTFGVTIEPYGGGTGLQTNTLLTAAAGTANYDTGNLNAAIDLSSFSGTAVRISFDATIPEYFTGPGCLELDNVMLNYAPQPSLLINRSGPQFVLSWPALFSNFVPVHAVSLLAPVAWSPLNTNFILYGATNNSLTLLPGSGDHFYRLQSR